MQTLVDLGLSSGVFGDLDADGMICTDDQTQMASLSSPATTLADANYLAAADSNLDGVIDGTDQQAFNTLYQSLPDTNSNNIPDNCEPLIVGAWNLITHGSAGEFALVLDPGSSVVQPRLPGAIKLGYQMSLDLDPATVTSANTQISCVTACSGTVKPLGGDLDRSGSVTTGDLSQLRFFFNQTADQTNFVWDYDASGVITTGD